MTGLEIAVIGMAGRFPGAKTVEEFWSNLKNGVESISFSTEEDWENTGMNRELLENPNFVKAKGGVLENKELFDASFFGYTPKEAEIMDPQIRIFHECSWEALENAGYNHDTYDGAIGIYAGARLNLDWHARSVLSGKLEALGHFEAGQLTDKDFLSARVAYKMNLKGPAVAVQTACSTSLVAIHLACRALLMGECDMALAGGVNISPVERNGYIYQEGMVTSPDGHCRAFDAEAKGTIGGEGAGVVVLKKLKSAASDRDNIRAVVLGSAVNNDGNRKVGFTAPSINAQTSLVKTVHHITRIEPESITYIESHGTGTPLGDPIEVESWKQAFDTDKRGFCRIGSVKTNIGHLDCAAGVAGFIKTVLALEHRLIPPSLHFERPNPKIDFENSPFMVNTALYEWKNDEYPLRAAVNSLGMGGTNAFVLLEEAPSETAVGPVAGHSSRDASRDYQLILLSAGSQSALDKSAGNLAEYLKNNPRTNPADMAYTLHVGRKTFRHRRKFVCSHREEAIDILTSSDPRKIQTFVPNDEKKTIVFMLPGVGPQYVNMGLDLYRSEPVFRDAMDRCFEILKPIVGYDLKAILYPDKESSEEALIDTFEIAQAVIFIFEYALATLLMKWGIKPDVMIGYSLGEYTAACLSGVFSLEDALSIIAARGKLIQRTAPGAMLSVPLPQERLRPLLERFVSLSLGIDNGPSCIVSGPAEEIAAFEDELKKERLVCMRLKASHAIHSGMMGPILNEFEEEVGKAALNPPRVPYISNLTGTLIKAGEAASPRYWAGHLGKTVRFAEGITQLLEKKNVIFVEVGPDRDLCTLLTEKLDIHSNQRAVNLVRHPRNNISDLHYLLSKIGQLWLYDVNIDGGAIYREEKRHRIPLPTYPFERQPYWIDRAPVSSSAHGAVEDSIMRKKPDIADWFYHPTWTRTMMGATHDGDDKDNVFNWLVFHNPEDRFCSLFIDRLKKDGHTVVTVARAPGFSRSADGSYAIDPGKENDYGRLLDELNKQGKLPHRLIHFWSLTDKGNETAKSEIDWVDIDNALVPGFYSLVYLAKALGNQRIMEEIQLLVITGHLHEVTGREVLNPQNAPLLGPLMVIPQEYPFIRCRNIDILPAEPGSADESKLIDQLSDELKIETPDKIVAYRDNYRWVQTFRPVRFGKAKEKLPQLRDNGVYLVTGGLGKIGLTLAEYLVRHVKARLVLTGRTPLPEKDRWEQFPAADAGDDDTASKIRKLMELEARGGRVLYSNVDVTDLEGMRRLISQAEETFGPIDGIIHAAGDTGNSVMRAIEQLNESDCKKQFLPKIYGLLTLEKVIRNKTPDFCWLTSSLSPILGGLGFSAYSAANHFMDAFVHYYNRENSARWISVNWADWKFGKEKNRHVREETGKVDWQITRDEGIETFRRILYHCKDNQLAVSTVDLQTRIDHWVKMESIREEPPGKKVSTSYRARPQLENTFVEPSNHLERAIADVLQEFLGIEAVGIHDNFFELGATSLNIIRINGQLRTKLNRDISIVLWFEYPTIGALADYLFAEKSDGASGDAESEQPEVIDERKNKLKQMSVKLKRGSSE